MLRPGLPSSAIDLPRPRYLDLSQCLRSKPQCIEMAFEKRDAQGFELSAILPMAQMLPLDCSTQALVNRNSERHQIPESMIQKHAFDLCGIHRFACVAESLKLPASSRDRISITVRLTPSAIGVLAIHPVSELILEQSKCTNGLSPIQPRSPPVYLNVTRSSPIVVQTVNARELTSSNVEWPRL